MREKRPFSLRRASVCAAIAIGFVLAVLAAPAGRAAPTGQSITPGPYGAIVSQTTDETLHVTETHLANGLTILTKESHAAPVAYFGVFYKVGSRNEVSGHTGLSHILEHMMFKGTKDLPPGAIARLFQANGGDINAETSQDYTYYHELIAADRLELAVRVEADRMENSAFDPTQLKHEMTVVRSELEGDSNSPGYQLYDFVFLPEAFVAHPYHWPTIGWIPDVENVATHRDVIYQYYKEHYMPNNATVVVVGDFDTKRIVALCQKYFGVYPAGNLETHFITPEPTQHGERRAVLRRPGTVGEVLIGYHVPKVGVHAHYVLDVISQILSYGESGRLYQSLVETGLAEDANAGDPDNKDAYLFEMDADAREGVANDKLEAAMEHEISRLQTEPVTEDELSRAKEQIDAQFIFQNDSVSDQAEQLGYYASIASYHYLDTYLDHIHAVTAQDIMDVANTYLTPENRNVAAFEPQPLAQGEAPPPPPVVDNFGAVTTEATASQKAQLAALEAKFNTGAPVKPAHHPLPMRTVLPNGMTVLVLENHSNPTVAIDGTVEAGDMFDPAGKYDVGSMTAGMLSKGTTTKSALQIATALESVGSSVSISAGVEGASFSGSSLTRNLPLTLSTLADELMNPSFPSDQFELMRGQSISGLEQAREDAGGTGGAGAVADIAFSEALYPKGHPYWQPSIDDEEAALKAMTVDDLKQFYQTYYRPDRTVIVVVGDVDAAAVTRQIAGAFAGWQKPATPPAALIIPNVPLSPAPAKPIFVNIPDTSQTSILWGYPGQLTRTDKDFYAVMVMNYILGGSFLSSHLGSVIRDRDGLAYSVYSDFDAGHGAGPFEIFVGTNPDNAYHAVADLKQVVADFRKNGATPEEVKEAIDYLTGSYPLTLETNSGVAGVIDAEEDFGLGLDYVNKRADLYRAVTVADVNRVARQYLHPEDAVLVIAGATPRQ